MPLLFAPIALGAVSAISFLLTPRDANASKGGGGGGGGKITPINPPINPPHNVPNSPFPPGSTLAVVLSPGDSRGMAVCDSPSPCSGTTRQISASARKGATVAVLQQDIPEDNLPDTPGKNRWWKIIAPDGTQGFSRAIGPNGEANFQITDNGNGGLANNGGGETPIVQTFAGVGAAWPSQFYNRMNAFGPNSGIAYNVSNISAADRLRRMRAEAQNSSPLGGMVPGQRVEITAQPPLDGIPFQPSALFIPPHGNSIPSRGMASARPLPVSPSNQVSIGASGGAAWPSQFYPSQSTSWSPSRGMLGARAAFERGPQGSRGR